MADNTLLNPGVGGKTMRTLQDAGGVDYPVGVFAYATTVSDGANVIQLVDASHGLPVALVGDVTVKQATAANLKAEVTFASGSTVALAGGSTVAATQSGAWSVGVSGSVTVAQSTASNLKAEVSQATAANLNATVVQSNAANLKATVTQAGPVTVAQATAANLKATVTQAGPVTVQQATASSLKAEVTIAAGQAVGISGPVAVTQSGTWTVNLGTGATIDLDPNAELKLGANNKLIGKIAAGVDGATVYDGATALTPKFAKISVSSAGDNVIVMAPGATKRIRVLRWGLTASGEVTVQWKSGATELTGPRPLTKYASAGGAYCPVGIFEATAEVALSLNLSAAVAVGGEITYVEVPDLG